MFVAQVQQEAEETAYKIHVSSCAFNGRAPVDVDEGLLAAAPRHSGMPFPQVLVIGLGGRGGGSPGCLFTPCPFACVHSKVSPRRVPCASPPAVLVEPTSRHFTPETLEATPPRCVLPSLLSVMIPVVFDAQVPREAGQTCTRSQ